MATKLVDAMRTENVLTENGMITNSTTLNACTDLFGDIGAMRGQDKNRLITLFSKAYGEDPMTAMRILFWSRDVRGGSGERQVFRDIFQLFLSVNHPDVAEKNISIIPEFGRWDDLLITENTDLEKPAIEFIVSALKSAHGLAAKWMPRKGSFANKIRKYMQLTPKDFRKLLVNLSNTVEQKLCAKDYESINYSHVPSLAMSRYMTAFHKRDQARFVIYREALKKGEPGVKVNAGAVYPYDIIKSIKHGGDKTVNQKQWEALDNFLINSTERILPMADISGSMDRAVGNNQNLRAVDVALSLALYISERNEGSFKDAFMTFTEVPILQFLTGKNNIADRLTQLGRHAGLNTNIESAFRSLLDHAVNNKVVQEEMPTMMLILSDMEFDAFRNWDNPTAQNMVEKLYAEANAKLKASGTDIVYVVPKTVWWKINARQDNQPVQFGKTGSALVSGFSPALLKSILSGGLSEFTPYNVMMKTISDTRYDVVQI
jgi:hypothetical protein